MANMIIPTQENHYYDEQSDVRVHYRFRPAKDDRHHLIVILSGFRDPLRSVDFNAASESLTSHVAWIYDDFEGMPGYYHWGKGMKDLSGAVNLTIVDLALQLGLALDQVTLFGLSKGANAALLLSAKYGYTNVIASAPRVNNGSSMYKYHRKVYDYITSGLESDRNIISELDGQLAKLVDQDRNASKNIYVITSPADETRYYPEATTLSKILSRYEGFRLIQTNSPIVGHHIAVSRYNVPLYISLLNLLADGFTPKLEGRQVKDAKFDSLGGDLRKAIGNGSHNVDHSELALSSLSPVWMPGQLRAAVKSVNLDERARLRLNGYAVINGLPSDRYGLAEYTLVLRQKFGSRNAVRFPLGVLKDPELSSMLYNSKPIDYSHGAIATQQQRGINVTDLPKGQYEVGLEAKRDGQTKAIERVAAPKHEKWVVSGSSLICSRSDGKSWEIISTSSVGRPITDCYFELKQCAIQDGRLYVEGYFIPYGGNYIQWNDISYYLVLEREQEPSGITATYTFELANGKKQDASRKSGETWRQQQTAYFATRKYAGLDLNEIHPGTYRVTITGRKGDDVFSRGLKKGIRVESSSFNQLDTKPAVGIIGSCVSRDNFNTKLSPFWRQYWTLGPTFYQSSLVSLMSPPVDHSDLSFGDLELHDRAVTQADFSKEFLSELEFARPQILLVDLFADMRFGVTRFRNSWVTRNELKLLQSKDFLEDESAVSLGRRWNPDKYLDIFRESVEALQSFIANRTPNTVVCLNRARNVYLHRAPDERGAVFDLKLIRSQNEFWRELDQIFIDSFDPAMVDPLDAEVQGDSAHRWGPGPVHYESDYYTSFHPRLRKAIGGEMNLTATNVDRELI